MGVRRFKTALGSQVKNYGIGSGKVNLNPNASGGTITDVNGYRIHTFTTTGTNYFQIISGSFNAEITLIGGGGGGSAGNAQWAAGGGGGGYMEVVFQVSPGSYSINVGAAGLAQTTCNNANWTDSGKGGNSQFSTLIAGGGSGGNNASVGGAGAGGTNITTGALSVIKNYSGQTPYFSSGDNLNAGGHNGLRNSEGITTYGSGASGVANGNPGTHATGNGNGGGGGPSCQGGHRGGGNGSQGLVIVKYLLSGYAFD